MLVDRGPELEKLHLALNGVAAGSSASVLVIGDSGTGKSYLLDSFLRDIEGVHRDLVVACGSGDPVAGRTTNLRPIREILGHLTGLLSESKTAAVRSTSDQSRLGHVRTAVLTNLMQEDYDLLNILSLPHPSIDALETAGIPQSTIQNWLRTLDEQPSTNAPIEPAEVLRKLSRLLSGIPTLLALVIDDLQWVDAASLELFLSLPRELPQQRIMFFATAMTGGETADRLAGNKTIVDIVTSLGRTSHNIIIDLNQARHDRGKQFCRAFLSERRLPASGADIDNLLALTGGNALAVRDVLDAVQRTLSSEANRSPAKGKHLLPEIDWSLLPHRHVDILNQRLARLDPVATQLLETAAVEGQEFTIEVLANIHKLDKLQVLEIMDKQLRLQHRLVDDLSPNTPESTELNNSIGTISQFKFEHGFYRKHIYETRIAPSRRRELHRRIANELRDIWQDRSDQIAGQLAHHFHLAGETTLAIRYYATAARTNSSLANFDAASLCVDEGLRLAARSDQSSKPNGDLQLLCEIGASTARARGLFKKSEQLARQGLALPKVPRSIRIKLQSELARSLYNQDVNFDEAETLLRAAISAARRNPAHALLPDLSRQLGIVFQRQGRYLEALNEYLTGLDNVGRPAGSIIVADIINSVGVSYALTGFFDFSVECQETALAVASTVGNHSRDTLFLNDAAAPLRRLGKWDAALDVSTRSRDLAAEQGKTGAVARGIYEAAQVYRVQEQWSSYADRLETVLDYDAQLLGQGPTLARARGELLLLRRMFPDLKGRRQLSLTSIEADAARLTGTTELHSPDLVYAACATVADGEHIRERLMRIVQEINPSQGNICWAWPFVAGIALLAASKCGNNSEPDQLHGRGIAALEDAHFRFGLPGVWRDVDFLGRVLGMAFGFTWPAIDPPDLTERRLSPQLVGMIPEFRQRFRYFLKGDRVSLS